jgi:hypothetical protein
MEELSFKKWLMEMGGATDAIVGSCASTADYQVQGACSDLKARKPKRKKNEQSIPDATKS